MELKPCPFCGYSAYMADIDSGEIWSVFCEQCGASSGYCDDQDQAAEQWNTRTNQEQRDD